MLTFEAVKSHSRMSEAVARQIESKILLGEINPLSMLPSESSLMSQFGVSRSTVREALKMLEASGMVAIKHGAKGGAIVTQLSEEFISDFLIKAVRLGRFSADSLAQFRLALEPSMAEMLAREKDINTGLIKEMEANISHVKEKYKANEITKYENMDFHLLLALATGNPMFVIVMKTLRVSLNAFVPQHIRQELQGATIRHHEKILDAIKRRDSTLAKEQMYKHLVEFRQIFRTEGRVRAKGSRAK
jgi:GntR family transcriptional repressor for pyruvate dehydrogenase complex